MTVAPAVTQTTYLLIGANLGPFATVWPYEQAGDVQVWLNLAATAELLSAGVDYTLVGPTPLLTGGGVTLSAGRLPAGGWTGAASIALVRATAQDQPSAFGEALGFSPAAMEAAVDHLERQVQDLKADEARALRRAPGQTTPFDAQGVSVTALAAATDPSGAVTLAQAGALIAQAAGFTPQNSIASYAAVRALVTLPGAAVYVTGRTALGDGGQGWFVYDALSAGADDGGVLLVDAAGRRWRRMFVGVAVPPEWWGAVSDGVVDCLAAFGAARNYLIGRGGGTIAAYGRAYRMSAPLTFVQATGILVQGAGIKATSLVFDAAVTQGIVWGDQAAITLAIRCGVQSLTITRAGDVVPLNSVGIDAKLFNYLSERDVAVDRFFFGRSIDGRTDGISIQYDAWGPYASNIKGFDWRLGNSAGVKVIGGEGGQNGGELFDREACVLVTGLFNDAMFVGHHFIPIGPGVVKPGVVSFKSYNGATGVLSFVNCNTESTQNGFTSDNLTAVINEINIIGGRWAVSGVLFNLNAATQFHQSELIGITTGAAMTLVAPKWVRVVDSSFGDNVTLIGGAGASLMFQGNTVLGAASFSGAWAGLTIGPNSFMGAVADTATGTVTRATRPDLTTAASNGRLVVNGVQYLWGTVVGNAGADTAVAFSTPFSALPRLTAQVKATGAAVGTLYSVTTYGLGTAGFTGGGRFTAGGAPARAAEDWDWQAIGPA